MRIAETIDAFYGDAGTKDGVSRSYKQAVEDLDADREMGSRTVVLWLLSAPLMFTRQ
jgi:hypothetical protein